MINSVEAAAKFGKEIGFELDGWRENQRRDEQIRSQGGRADAFFLVAHAHEH
jgi:hypothetical protein